MAALMRMAGSPPGEDGDDEDFADLPALEDVLLDEDDDDCAHDDDVPGENTLMQFSRLESRKRPATRSPSVSPEKAAPDREHVSLDCASKLTGNSNAQGSSASRR